MLEMTMRTKTMKNCKTFAHRLPNIQAETPNRYQVEKIMNHDAKFPDVSRM
jgi:hypothetical protein